MRVLPPFVAMALASCGDTSPPGFSSEPGITSVSVDHAKGAISIAGSGLDLGAFTPGGNPVTVTITRGGDTRTATIRMALAGTKLGY